MRRRMKKVSALILAASLLCSAFVLPEVYAAVGVKKPEKGCSLQVNCGAQIKVTDNKDKTDVLREPYNPIYSEVASDEVEVRVNIYRVADIQVTGKYKPVAQFSSLTELENVSYITKAKDWQNFAATAKNIVDNDKIQPTKTGLTKNGSITFTGLEMGMYLIDAQKLLTAEYRYEFTPYLISLPNNYYYDYVKTAESSDPVGEVPANADEWIYNLVGEHAVGLKPQQFERFGYVVIQKNLTNFDIKDPNDVKNPSAVFVFEVKAEKDEDVVFNDVVAIDFYASGKDWVKVGPIKAGATVTVTEEYQGANYAKDGEVVLSDNPFVIKAEPAWDKWDTLKNEEKQALQRELLSEIKSVDIIATFENKHNNVPNSGTGVVNTFKAGASWGLVQDYQGQSAPQQSVPQQ